MKVLLVLNTLCLLILFGTIIYVDKRTDREYSRIRQDMNSVMDVCIINYNIQRDINTGISNSVDILETRIIKLENWRASPWRK